MKNTFKINEFVVGDNLNPYIIAEIGVNHEGDIELAKQLIEEAAEGGAHAAKFQSYKAGLIASKNSPAYWDQTKEPTDSQYKLFQKYDNFGPEEYIELAKHCKKVGIDFMSTPFDLDAVDFLNPLMPAFKVASADITNVPLIRKCAQQGKPLIMSTGAATLAEIEFALEIAKDAGAKEISILHCVLNYPTPEENAQLGMIEVLKRVFPEQVIGYSDHVCPDETISALESAMLLGATILEKHFTHDKSLAGNDHYHAMNKEDLKAFVTKAKKYKTLISTASKDLSKETAARTHARRSIVVKGDLSKGHVITENDIIAKRPAHGISPIHWDEIVGKTLDVGVKDDTLMLWKNLV
ncbi:N-acetylneuraminate synthase family protein [Colwellia sp. MB3u-70]|uniref:N-acetylneuraminate synthase family protein n=1 Tax=unclassified Colwellia TaxID=196834 RepID=UPI0015F3D4F0|nr:MULTISPECIES: N-acetylneuraminate synthase family protein [unclassified Colwellia]MBA6291504.1 N-acetylneuraminate synthase family protein [Colwellia sp. MB3u-8]MBA6305646.1 N-acetylneuraminate synthase family protein [Colwellia sp. MB3u-70]